MPTRAEIADRLSQLANDPAAFRAALLVDRDGTPTPYGRIQTDWQRADNEALDPAWKRIAGRSTQEAAVKRLWSERPRGASKSTDLGVAVLWVLFAAKSPISGVGVAADLDQGRLLLKAISTIVALNGWLNDFVEVQKDRVWNKHTGAEFVVIASDSGSSYGLTPDFVVADEVSHWPDGRGQAMWESIVSSAAKRRHCVFACILNAGWKSSWQWTLREAIRLDPRWRFSRLESPPDWIDAERLAEQQRLLPEEAYRRLWLNQWVEGTGSGLNLVALTECCCRPRPLFFRPRGTGIEALAGVDLGLRRDHAAMVIVLADPQRGRLVLANELNWNPTAFGGEIPLHLIREAIADARVKYELANVVCDEWQAAQLIQEIRGTGLNVIVRPTTSKQLSTEATALMEFVNDRILELYPSMTCEDLKKVRIVERPVGFKLEWPRDGQGHCDRGAALASVLPAAKGVLDMLISGDCDDTSGDILSVSQVLGANRAGYWPDDDLLRGQRWG